MATLALVSELGGSILVLFGYEVWMGSLLVIAFCIAANLLSHRYWEASPAEQGPIILQFYKNVALMGGLLFLCVSGPGRWSLSGWLPSISQRLIGKSRWLAANGMAGRS
jgi:putative oxidoreductase